MSVSLPRAYLAGPGVFRPDHEAYADGLKVICRVHGIEGVFPMDATIPPQASQAATAAAIRAANLELIRGCDLVLAEMTPFRGPGMDGGTAYEMGFAAALDRPVFAWSPEGTDYKQRVEQMALENGMSVEDFGLVDNLMMACGSSDGVIHDSFEAAVRSAAFYLEDPVG